MPGQQSPLTPEEYERLAADAKDIVRTYVDALNEDHWDILHGGAKQGGKTHAMKMVEAKLEELRLQYKQDVMSDAARDRISRALREGTWDGNSDDDTAAKPPVDGLASQGPRNPRDDRSGRPWTSRGPEAWPGLGQHAG